MRLEEPGGGKPHDHTGKVSSAKHNLAMER